jgi:hypothetical protein
MVRRSGVVEDKLSQRVIQALQARLAAYSTDPTAAALAAESHRDEIPPAVRANIDVVLDHSASSYREVLLIQLGYRHFEPQFDPTVPPPGGRSVASQLGRELKKSHIKATVDALQIVGKGRPSLLSGQIASYDQLLLWAKEASATEVYAALEYTLAKLVLKARPVLSMPILDSGKLTFFEMMRLLDVLLSRPSGGAHQQFAVAACLEALIDEFGLSGIAGLRVETKTITASDASSRSAGDIQVKRGNRTEEAIEVSAADWRLKLDQAVAAIQSADLPRAHVLAAVRAGPIPSDLGKIDADISVIDTRAFLTTLVAVMRKPARAAALRRLHELLERHGANVDLVNAYVDLVRQHGLVA